MPAPRRGPGLRPGRLDPGLHERAAELGVRAAAYLVDPDGAGLEALARLVRDGRLRVRLARTFPLAEAAAAHDLVATGRTTGKVVLTVTDQADRTPSGS